MKQYRKLPVTIDAICWTGKNIEEVIEFTKGSAKVLIDDEGTHLVIKTLEGRHEATINDMIIKGVKGEFYPCKNGIFWMTYEKVE